MLRQKPQIWCVLLAPILLFAGFQVRAAGLLTKTTEDLPNFQKVDEHLFRGAQPTEAGIGRLKELKVKTVVDLRPDEAQVATERRWVESAGMKFVNIPLNGWFRPKEADIERVLQVIEEPQNQPVFVHCRRGADRTGTVTAVYRIADYHWTAQLAIQEAKQHKLGWWQFWMKDFIKDYYRHQQGKRHVTDPAADQGAARYRSKVPVNAIVAAAPRTRCISTARDGASMGGFAVTRISNLVLA